MSTENLRREFLKRASAGLAGTGLAFQAGQGIAHAAGNPPGTGFFDVRAFGATGDGKTLDSPAINKAIDAASAAGGGTVLFPAGNYLCYSIHLKSDISLYLDAGATIIAADPPAQGGGGFDPAEPNEWDKYQDFGHSHFHNSLIWGESLGNIAILGYGRIWGRSLSRGEGPQGPGAQTPGVGNKAISLKNCHNVLLRDFSILHGGHFGVLATGIDNFTLDNLKIDTDRDGMDIDCCRNVRISNCYVNSPADDGICLKADHALGSSKQTEFVTITNCYVSGCWEIGTLLDGTYKRARIGGTGRIKFGTESDGGFRNITISNCVFEGCQGLALETVDGAILEDITVTNISMRDIISAPIFLRLGRRLRAPDGRPIGTLKRVIISNITCSGCSPGLGSVISGIPGHYVEDVKISNIQVLHHGGGTKEDAAFQPLENEDVYPEPNMFLAESRHGNGRGPNGQFVPEGQGRGAAGGRGPAPGQQPAGRGAAPGQQPGRGATGGPPPVMHSMPSHGFYVRHARGIQFDNIEIKAEKEDQRPLFVLDDVQGADFFRIRGSRTAGVPVFALHNVADFDVHMCAGVPDTQLAKADQKTL